MGLLSGFLFQWKYYFCHFTVFKVYKFSLMKLRQFAIIIFVILIVTAIVATLLFYWERSENSAAEIPVQSENHEPLLIYGIAADSLLVFRETVKKNEFLSDLLLNYHVDYPTIDLLAKRSQPVFDVRKIRAGNHYTVLCTDDSLQKVQYFIYESSPTSYVVFDLRDSVHVHRGEKDVVIQTMSTSGTINSSLWNAMVDNHTDPNLAIELSEIYAWTIDFFGIQKGDSYKAIYEELYVDSTCIGIGKVQAALFTNSNHDFYAFYYTQDSVGDYFDDAGKSLRRTFLKAPLRYSRISSRFSNSRMHPILKIRRPHHGVDYAAPTGTPVHAIGDGTVVVAGFSGGGGRTVKIRHNGVYTTSYMHLSGFAKGIRSGVHVSQGEVIGYVGSSGLATGPHLDFRFYKNGDAIDPLTVQSPPAEPVNPANLTDYFKWVNTFKTRLDSIQVPTPLATSEK